MSVVHYTARVRSDHLLELPWEARRLVSPGQEISIDLDDAIATPPPRPNEDALATLQAIAEMKKGMRETDGSQTDRIIREGRANFLGLARPIWKDLSDEEWEAVMDSRVVNVPDISPESLRRENLYED